jgi:hypothetical protein
VSDYCLTAHDQLSSYSMAMTSYILMLHKTNILHLCSASSLEMSVPSQGHYGFHSFPVVD